jgi:hypothetical protein
VYGCLCLLSCIYCHSLDERKKVLYAPVFNAHRFRLIGPLAIYTVKKLNVRVPLNRKYGTRTFNFFLKAWFNLDE